MDNLKEKVIEMIDKDHVGVLSTLQGNKPHARIMMFFHDDLQIYTVTNRKTHKVEEIQSNPNVHVLLGFQKEGNEYVELEGVASIVEDPALKQKYWSDQLKPWLDGPDDPELCLLEINPEHIELVQGNSETTIM